MVIIKSNLLKNFLKNSLWELKLPVKELIKQPTVSPKETSLTFVLSAGRVNWL